MRNTTPFPRREMDLLLTRGSSETGESKFVMLAQRVYEPLRAWSSGYHSVPRTEMPELHYRLQSGVALMHSALSRWHRQPVRDDPVTALHGLLHGLELRCFVGLRLFALRQETGRSLRDIADQVGLTQPFLGQIERMAAGLPGLEAGQLLLELLGLGPSGAAEDRQQVVAESPAPDVERTRALAALKRRLDKLDTEGLRLLVELAGAVFIYRESTESAHATGGPKAPRTRTPREVADRARNVLRHLGEIDE